MGDTSTKPAIAIHGGAGVIPRADLATGRETAIRAALKDSVEAGYRTLLEGATSTDAVAAAIRVMEDSPLFNAGKGSVFNADGKHEMDASIMAGNGLKAGAIAAVRHIRNPIDLALEVMTESEHVMLLGDGAEEFARQQGFEMVDPDYFSTEFRRQQLRRIKAREDAVKPTVNSDQDDQWYSTVGVVALDVHGELAAGTSTGGTANKRYGRVGDSPIIGAGTYASSYCAVSATGHGEFFIRHVVAYDICKRVELGASLADATDAMVNDILVKAGGEGGVIAMDGQGNIAMPFNSEGMYRAAIDANGQVKVSIYREDGSTGPALTDTVEH